MDVRYVAWAGYQLEYTTTSVGSVDPPEFETEDVGELRMAGSDLASTAKLSGKNLTPKLVAFPGPTE